MKHSLLMRTMACCMAGSLMVGTAIAQQGDEQNSSGTTGNSGSTQQQSSPSSGSSSYGSQSQPGTQSQYSSGSMRGQKSERLSQLMGSTVKDNQGNTIGQINDFVVNPMSGRIQFAVISLNDQAGKLTAVPWQLVRPGADPTSCTLRASKDTLSSTQTFDASSWPDFSQPSTSQQIYSHFGIQAPGHFGAGNEGGIGSGNYGTSGQGYQGQRYQGQGYQGQGTSGQGYQGQGTQGTSGSTPNQ